MSSRYRTSKSSRARAKRAAKSAWPPRALWSATRRSAIDSTTGGAAVAIRSCLDGVGEDSTRATTRQRRGRREGGLRIRYVSSSRYLTKLDESRASRSREVDRDEDARMQARPMLV